MGYFERTLAECFSSAIKPGIFLAEDDRLFYGYAPMGYFERTLAECFSSAMKPGIFLAEDDRLFYGYAPIGKLARTLDECFSSAIKPGICLLFVTEHYNGRASSAHLHNDLAGGPPRPGIFLMKGACFLCKNPGSFDPGLILHLENYLLPAI